MGHEEGLVDDGKQQLKQLKRQVRIWKFLVTGFAVCLIISYLMYFGVHLGQSPATDANTWGTFGDFVGGLMNPVVAFAAFFWLTESVKIQKQELAETRSELKKASDAQTKLVENGRESVRLAALTALSNIYSNRVARHQERLSNIEQELSEVRVKLINIRRYSGWQTHPVTSRENDLLKEERQLRDELEVLVKKSQAYVKEIGDIFEA